MTPKEGTFPMLCSWFKDSLQSGKCQKKDLIGMMLMDRMKMRSEFYLNPKTDQCVGLVVYSSSSKTCLSDEGNKLLLENER